MQVLRSNEMFDFVPVDPEFFSTSCDSLRCEMILQGFPGNAAANRLPPGFAKERQNVAIFIVPGDRCGELQIEIGDYRASRFGDFEHCVANISIDQSYSLTKKLAPGLAASVGLLPCRAEFVRAPACECGQKRFSLTQILVCLCVALPSTSCHDELVYRVSLWCGHEYVNAGPVQYDGRLRLTDQEVKKAKWLGMSTQRRQCFRGICVRTCVGSKEIDTDACCGTVHRDSLRIADVWYFSE